MILYLRAVAYFCLRYFLKLGFLDGLAGFRWHFWQGLWYRWIVDREIGRMKRVGCGDQWWPCRLLAGKDAKILTTKYTKYTKDECGGLIIPW